MYETYVPITETVVERRPPTIAEIVRQKTDDGARIIDFFLDIMEGRVDDAKLCHRIDAAKQLVKYGYKKAVDFLAEHGDEPCDHCESRRRGPRPRRDTRPAARPQHAPGPFGYDFLTMLTEDFLTVVSAVDEDLMIKLLRAQTRDGGTVIDFLDSVMHGREDGFRVNHRISAARELISHLLRDEHVIARTVLEVVADPRVRPLPGPETPAPVEPARARPEPAEGYSIRGAGLKPVLPGAAWEPCNPESSVPAYPVVVPAKAGTQRGGAGRSSHPIPVHSEPVLSTVEEPVKGAAANSIVVPEKSGFLPQEPSPTHPRPNGTVAIAGGPGPEQPGTHTQTPDPGPVLSTVEGPVLSPAEGRQAYEGRKPRSRPSRTQRRREGNARAAMRRRPLGSERIADPYGALIGSTTPGRSPPR